VATEAWKSLLVMRLAGVMPEPEALLQMPLIEEIRDLKATRRAIIIAHNYQVPLITAGVADFTGDSLAMARFAAQTTADTIVVCGVRFMAETAKLLSPDRTVLLPAAEAGCSLAESITAADVRALRARYPGAPVVAYVNTTAAVKAEADICCTSGNAVAVVESLGSPRVIVLPDRFLAGFVAERVACEVIAWPGSCEVHERFSAADISPYRGHGVRVLAHPECPPDVQAEADFVGSTAAMIAYLSAAPPGRVLLLTECSMADNVSLARPDIQFERPCNLCRHMKAVTLEKVRNALRDGHASVGIDPDTAERARRPLERMLAVRTMGARG
jgi:quinolinate synthase